MFIEWEPLRVKSEAFVHLQGRHPVWDILINRKRQMEEILHLPFVVEIDLCDVHGLHGFCAGRHLSTEIVCVLVNGEDRAEVEEEAQTPCNRADQQDGGL